MWSTVHAVQYELGRFRSSRGQLKENTYLHLVTIQDKTSVPQAKRSTYVPLPLRSLRNTASLAHLPALSVRRGEGGQRDHPQSPQVA